MKIDKWIFEQIEKGINYHDFMETSRIELDSDTQSFSTDKYKERFKFKKLNFARSKRLEKQYAPSNKAIELISKIDEPQTWLILTESWCGDSAQNIPVIAKLAALNKNISLKILLRDSNPGIMNKYLTNRARAIPKLVAFNTNGEELFRWGPRPRIAQELVLTKKQQGIPKTDWEKELHLWYAENRGNETEKELLSLIEKILGEKLVTAI